MTDTYYRHSGRAPIPGIVGGLATGILAAIVLSLIYAYVILYIPIIGYVTFILTALCGCGVGFAMGTVLSLGKVRNNTVAMSLGVAVGLVTLWASWVFYVYALLHRGGRESEATMLGIALNPDAMWEVIRQVNDVGAWSFKSFRPTGGVLWAFWLGEAVIIVGGATIAAWAVIAGSPFCERCEQWCEETKGVGTCNEGEPTQLKQHLEQKRFEILETLGAVLPTAKSWYRWDLASCKDCGATNTLSIQKMTLEVEKGKPKTNSVEVIGKLLLAPDEVAPLIHLGRRLGKREPEAASQVAA
jgi:hypothetical protein